MRVDTVIFDLDGTLVNSLDGYYAVFVEVFAEFGLPTTDRAELIQLMGRGQDIIEALVPIDWPDREETKRRCRTLFRELWYGQHTTHMSLYPQVPDTIRELFDRRFSLGIATAAEGSWIEQLLRGNEIAQYFGAVVTYADVPVRKPAPDILVECLTRLGGNPARSVYVGDSPIDIIAAKAAGVQAIGVLIGTSDLAALEAVQPDLVLEYLGQLATTLEKES